MPTDLIEETPGHAVHGILVVADAPEPAALLEAELELSGYRDRLTTFVARAEARPAAPPGLGAVVITATSAATCERLLDACADLPPGAPRLQFVPTRLDGNRGGGPGAQGADGAPHGSLSNLLRNLAEHVTPTRRPAPSTLVSDGDSEHKYRDLFERASDAILLVDLGTLQILEANQRVLDVYGFEPGQMIGMSLLDLAPRDEHLIMAGNIERIAAGERALKVERRTHIRRDGARIDVTISTGLLAYEGFVAMQGVIRDETRRLALETELVETNALLQREVVQRREAESKATYLALHDELTGLANRRLFFAHLDQALTVSARTKQPFAVVFLDLDGLKPVNDELGHHAGDLLLTAAAERFKECMRAADTLARLAGDEFGMLLRGMDNLEHCEAFAEKVLATLRAPLEIEGHRIEPSASLGFALYPIHGRRAEPLVRLADAAMYEAKRAGKGTYRAAVVAEDSAPRRRRGGGRG